MDAGMRVQIFDDQGTLVSVVGGDDFVLPDDGRKFGPEGIRFDDRGQAFVVDRGGRRILVYDTATLTRVRTIESPRFVDPTGLAVASDGRLFVADQGTDTIIALDADGSFLLEFERLDGDGVTILQKTETLALVEEDDLLLATSEDEARIEVFKLSTGDYLHASIGALQESVALADGRFGDDIEGIALDPVSRLLFASDEENGRVLVYDLDAGNDLFDPASDFAFLGSFGEAGSGEGQLVSADGIAVSAERGLVAVADQGNFRVQVFAVDDIRSWIGH